jgi:hypothetical protein
MLGLAERVGDSELIAFGLEKAAILAATENDAARAGRLAGAADVVRESAGIERSDFDREWLERHLAQVSGQEFEACRAESEREFEGTSIFLLQEVDSG